MQAGEQAWQRLSHRCASCDLALLHHRTWSLGHPHEGYLEEASCAAGASGAITKPGDNLSVRERGIRYIKYSISTQTDTLWLSKRGQVVFMIKGESKINSVMYGKTNTIL